MRRGKMRSGSKGVLGAEHPERTCAGNIEGQKRRSCLRTRFCSIDVMEYQFPLLSGLLYAAARDGGLSVVDFGGALGSTYFQCRDFLCGVKDFVGALSNSRRTCPVAS